MDRVPARAPTLSNEPPVVELATALEEPPFALLLTTWPLRVPLDCTRARSTPRRPRADAARRRKLWKQRQRPRVQRSASSGPRPIARASPSGCPHAHEGILPYFEDARDRQGGEGQATGGSLCMCRSTTTNGAACRPARSDTAYAACNRWADSNHHNCAFTALGRQRRKRRCNKSNLMDTATSTQSVDCIDTRSGRLNTSLLLLEPLEGSTGNPLLSCISAHTR